MHGPVFNLCYFLQMFSDLLMSQVSMPRLGPKTSTRVPPLETLSSEVALGASPFSRQMISIGSPSPQVLSMFSHTLMTAHCITYQETNILCFFLQIKMIEKYCEMHNGPKGSVLQK